MGGFGQTEVVPSPLLDSHHDSAQTICKTGDVFCAGNVCLGAQVNRGTRLVIMDKKGGSDAISIARSIAKLSPRKVYVVAVSLLHIICTIGITSLFCGSPP